MSGSPRSMVPTLKIELPVWQWIVAGLASPFVLMLAFKLSWETLYWWSQVVFTEEVTEQVFAGVLMSLVWVFGFIALMTLKCEGFIVFKIKRPA